MDGHKKLSSGAMMQKVEAGRALLPGGWAENVCVTIGPDGRITEVASGGTKAPSSGILLPAPVNAHSHAFQRAMAGLTERRGPDPQDSFWTWRQLMFRFLDQLTPSHVEAIAAFVQMEMLEAGYATSVEFHYLHHQPGGAPYDNPAEMSERIVAAAQTSGIGLCLLPVLYQFGGCDGRTLGPGQVRFGCDFDQFGALREAAGRAVARFGKDAKIGMAPHSLRAVAPEDLRRVTETFPSGPLHMHLAEQVAEVQELEAAWGLRPVDWALEHLNLNDRWCLIHCTQMQPAETTRLAKTGAVAGLCPITESNLGDGIFDAVRWFESGGRMAIGSDSNTRIALAEELRVLDYSQRLRDGTRAALASPEQSTGRRLFEAMLEGGAQAAQRNSGSVSVGCYADLLMLDGTHANLDGRRGDALLDTWIFAGDEGMVQDVWSAGRHKVQGGRHVARDQIEAAYRRVMTDLRDVL